MNSEWVLKHHELLQLMLKLDLQKSMILRIIDEVNRLLKTPEAAIRKTEEFISILKKCKTEADVAKMLDEMGL